MTHRIARERTFADTVLNLMFAEAEFGNAVSRHDIVKLLHSQGYLAWVADRAIAELLAGKKIVATDRNLYELAVE